MGLVKKLSCLDDTGTSFLEPFKLFIFYEKILDALKALKALKVLKAQKRNQAQAQIVNKLISDFFSLRCFLYTFFYFCLL